MYLITTTEGVDSGSGPCCFSQGLIQGYPLPQSACWSANRGLAIPLGLDSLVEFADFGEKWWAVL